MATVRINANIRYHVQSKLDAMFHAQKQSEWRKFENIGIAEACYSAMYSPEIRHAAELLFHHNPHWVKVSETFHVRCQFTDDDGLPQSAVFVATSASPLPHPRYGQGTFQLTPDLAPYAATVEVLKTVKKIEEDELAVKKNIVGKVLGTCSTLRQVLTLWPSAMDFMPDDVRDRHNQKEEKRTQLDLDTLAIDSDTQVSLMKARLVAGQ